MMQHKMGELSRSAFRVNERNVNKLCSADKKIQHRESKVPQKRFVANFGKLLRRRGKEAVGKGVQALLIKVLRTSIAKDTLFDRKSEYLITKMPFSKSKFQTLRENLLRTPRLTEKLMITALKSSARCL